MPVMATIKITVKQLKKLIAEQLEYENFFEKNIEELNEQVNFLSLVKENFGHQQPEDLQGRSERFGDGRFDRGYGDPSGLFGKKLAIIISKSPLLRKQIESIPGFDFKEFVSISNDSHSFDLYGKNIADVSAMNDAEYESFYKGQVGLGGESGWCYNLKGFIPYRYMIDNKIN